LCLSKIHGRRRLPGDARRRNDSDSNYHADLINSIICDHAIISRLSGYLEFFSDISTESHSVWGGAVDAGLERLVTENGQLDCGCNFGVKCAANAFYPFTGLTWRF